MSAGRVVVSAAVGLAALAGCTSNAEPTPAPTPTISSSPSPSPSASATPPAMPAAAEGTSPRAAKAFARHYIASVNNAMATGDTTHLRDLAGPRCRTCRAIVNGIDDAYADGGHLEGNGWSIRKAQYLRISSSVALISLSLHIAEQAAYKPDSQTPQRSKATRGHMDIRMRNSHGNWRVFDVKATQ